jgi:flagellar biosynthesis component FlhA
MVNEFLIRIGAFFTLIGIGLIILFVATYLGNAPDFKYFFLGLISMFIGWRLSKRKAPPPPSGRFAYIRKMRENSKKHQEEGKEGKKEED